jgi:steroid delta-isomerase-like uncharacterized protein
MTHQNKELVRRYVAAMNDHDIETVVKFASEDLVNHAAVPQAQGAEGLRTIFGKLWKAMPDMRWSCEDLIAEGDKVVCRVHIRATQTGPLEMARFPLPATGREVSTEQIHVFRIEGEKLVEHWAGRDDIGVLRQLGYPVGSSAPAVTS